MQITSYTPHTFYLIGFKGLDIQNHSQSRIAQPDHAQGI